SYLPLGGALLLYLVIRMAVLGGLGVGEREIGSLDNPAAEATSAVQWLTAPVLFSKYLQLLAWPHRLSADYSYNQIPLPTSLLDARVLLGVGLAILLVSCGLLAWKKGNRLLAFSIGALLPLLGYLHVFFPLGTILAERLAYFPSLGLCLLLGLGLAKARTQAPRAAVGLLLVFVLGWGARTAARNREWASNETLFRSTVVSSPASARSHFLLGTAWMDKEDFPEAAASFRRGLAIAPGHADGWASLGESLLLAKDFAGAEAAFREASRLDPTNAAFQHRLATSLYNMGRLEEALPAAHRALELDPDAAESRSLLSHLIVAAGRERVGEGDLDAAMDLFKRSFEIQPNTGAANDIGVALAMQGTLAEAERWHLRALELDPEDATAVHYLGMIAERRGQMGEARELYEKALVLHPHLVPALLNLASVLLNQGELARAESHYRRATQIEPPSYEAYNGLGIVLARMGRKDEAARAFQRAISIDPSLEAARENLRALGHPSP
ncbi:MAG: tetratricopeptide repeat protein, partial [Acidobacteriota bacterium]